MSRTRASLKAELKKAKFFLFRHTGSNVTVNITPTFEWVELSRFRVVRDSNHFRVGLSHNVNIFGLNCYSVR